MGSHDLPVAFAIAPPAENGRLSSAAEDAHMSTRDGSRVTAVVAVALAIVAPVAAAN